MMDVRRHDDERRREDAADWVVRLQAGDLSEADALAFDAWLEASPANARAYDEALGIAQAYERHAVELRDGLTARRPRPMPGRRAVLAFGGMAAAAAVAVMVLPQLTSEPQAQTFVTAKGERRTVKLADGSTLELNAGTRLSVTLARDGRHVILDKGQAVFDVAPNARRPFVIAAGDRTVRVVGTQFDVRRREGRLSVTVAEGAVEVRPVEGAPGRAYRLHPGQRLDHREGAADVRIATAEPAEVLGWRSGRLVYREQPLAEVVADLNQQFDTPIRIEGAELARAPVSGVLILDDQDAVIRRLALLLPISAVRSDAGVVLKAR